MTNWFYHLANLFIRFIAFVLVDLKVEGKHHVPETGPVLLAANHLSLADPPLLGALSGRVVHFMAKHELFRIPIVSQVIRGYTAYPVRRGSGDRAALTSTLRLLRDGEVVGIFPEGHRSKESALQAAHPGTALVAMRTGAVVVPAAVWGSEKIFRLCGRGLRPRVTVRFGAPIKLSASASSAASPAVAEGTEQIMRAIATMLPRDYRGVYGHVASGEQEGSN